MIVKYQDFRTGLTFGAVVQIIWAEREQEYAETGHYKGTPSRSLVLGKWRAIKLDMWSGIPPEEKDDDEF